MDSRVFPFIGILKVAAVLEQYGIDVEHLDLSGFTNYTDLIRIYCKDNPGVTFGLTATTPQIPAATEIVKTIREESPTSKIILGGTHITLINAARKLEEKMKHSDRAIREFNRLQKEYDCLIAGDGEYALLSVFKDGWVSFIDADQPKTDLFLKNEDLNQLPIPARHLLDMDSYNYSIDGERATTMIAQLGCPFSCFFCAGRDTPFLRRVRTRTSDKVINELKHIYEIYNHKGVMFFDDELNVNPNVIELMNDISDLSDSLSIDFKLRGFLKAELFNDEQAEAMYRAGFRWILTGFESGSPRILENIRKNATRDDNTRCVEIAKKHGFKVKALMSVGHSGESHKTINDTEKWLLEVQPDDFDVTVISPYAGSPYYDRAIKNNGHWTFTSKNGDTLHMKNTDYAREAHYYKGIPGEYISYVWTDDISDEELAIARDELEDSVRNKLNIPFNPSNPGFKYETSMGQTKLPSNILRSSR